LLPFFIPLALSGHDFFVEEVGGSGYERGWRVLPEGNGSILTSGYTQSFAQDVQDILLVSFDAEGIPARTLAVGRGGSSEAYDMIVTQDSGYAVTGFMHDPSESTDVFISRFDAGLALQWTMTIGGDDHDHAQAIIQTGDGGFALAGASRSFGPVDRSIIVSRLDSSGAHLWSRTLGRMSCDQAYGIVETKEKGLLVAGESQTSPCSADILMTLFDSLGTHLWTRIVDGSDWERASDLIHTQKNSFVLTGFTRAPGIGGSNLLIAEFDSLGNHLWSRIMVGIEDDRGSSVIETEDGSYLVAGFSRSFSADYDLVVSKFDHEGDPLWTRVISGVGDLYGYDVVECEDGRIVAVGTAWSPESSSSNLFLTRLDESGNTCMGSFEVPWVIDWAPTITEETPTVLVVDPEVETVTPTCTTHDPELIMDCPLCGDANSDLEVTSGDGFAIMNYLGGGSSLPYCWSANVNGDSEITPGDGYVLLNYLGLSGELDCAPCEFSDRVPGL
jgi:hypothetical protein